MLGTKMSMAKILTEKVPRTAGKALWIREGWLKSS